jgi:RHS repeat-associated protein
MSAATYDGNGLRTSSTTTPAGGSATTQSYLWDTSGSMPHLVMDSTNAYLYGPQNAPIEQVKLSDGTINYLVSDRLGSVRGTVNAVGSLTQSTSYDAWGNPQTSGGLSGLTPFGYAGDYTDPTGLNYNIRRYYDPATGQFVSVDPLVDRTEAPYAYVAGNPVNNYDLTGTAVRYGGIEEGGGGGVGFGGDSYLPPGGEGSIEEDLPGAPTGETPKRIFETPDVQAKTDAYHDLSQAKEREVIENGYVGRYEPHPENHVQPYVQYQLRGALSGRTGTYQVGGYWSGKFFTVTHAFFAR